ncbi:MAG: hypothetical protein QOJ31_1202 [Gaiellales bacterium]|nr:hypothetical protein [Gaiellales bacterium]MDX6546307.1 hypothetical protein [Gaiellales bacterium]MDX6550518.1 hypothetical protein [Gaiellales bacterium]
MADWVAISSLATAGGTLVLAGATFASVRSANRAARVAESALLVGLRPLLVPSRLNDIDQKVGFQDGKWVKLAGGSGVAEATREAVYLALSLRNVGSGMAVLHGWRLETGRAPGAPDRPSEEGFHRLTRDLYVPVGDVAFWQGTFRDPSRDDFNEAYAAVNDRTYMSVDLLYGDHEGGQRMISRFGMTPRDDGGWIGSGVRHWYIDRPAPR